MQYDLEVVERILRYFEDNGEKILNEIPLFGLIPVTLDAYLGEMVSSGLLVVSGETSTGSGKYHISITGRIVLQRLLRNQE